MCSRGDVWEHKESIVRNYQHDKLRPQFCQLLPPLARYCVQFFLKAYQNHPKSKKKTAHGAETTTQIHNTAHGAAITKTVHNFGKGSLLGRC